MGRTSDRIWNISGILYEQVEFSKKNQKDIQVLLKHNREIKVIISIQKSFSDFKELVNQYKAKNQILSEVVYAFEALY